MLQVEMCSLSHGPTCSLQLLQPLLYIPVVRLTSLSRVISKFLFTLINGFQIDFPPILIRHNIDCVWLCVARSKCALALTGKRCARECRLRREALYVLHACVRIE